MLGWCSEGQEAAHGCRPRGCRRKALEPGRTRVGRRLATGSSVVEHHIRGILEAPPVGLLAILFGQFTRKEAHGFGLTFGLFLGRGASILLILLSGVWLLLLLLLLGRPDGLAQSVLGLQHLARVRPGLVRFRDSGQGRFNPPGTAVNVLVFAPRLGTAPIDLDFVFQEHLEILRGIPFGGGFLGIALVKHVGRVVGFVNGHCLSGLVDGGGGDGGGGCGVLGGLFGLLGTPQGMAGGLPESLAVLTNFSITLTRARLCRCWRLGCQFGARVQFGQLGPSRSSWAAVLYVLG